MTFFEHMNVALSIVCTVGVIVAARKGVPGPFLWLLGAVAFVGFCLLAHWTIGDGPKPSPNARACTYRESPNALIIECAVPKTP